MLLGGLVLAALATTAFVVMRVRVARTQTWLRIPGEVVDYTVDNEGARMPVFAYDAPDGQRRTHQGTLAKNFPDATPALGEPVEVLVDPTDFLRATVPGWDGTNFALALVGIITGIGALIVTAVGLAGVTP